MGDGFALGVRRRSWWERAAIALAVAALHMAVFFALLAAHIVDFRRSPPPAPVTLSLVFLPAPAKPPPRVRQRKSGGQGGDRYFDVYSFTLPGQTAITLPSIQTYIARHPPERRHCPLVLRPDSADWKRLCAPEKNEPEGGEEEFDEAAIKRNAAIFARIEAERRKRFLPPKVPCSYTKKFARPPGGPYENSAAMADVGCLLGR